MRNAFFCCACFILLVLIPLAGQATEECDRYRRCSHQIAQLMIQAGHFRRESIEQWERNANTIYGEELGRTDVAGCQESFMTIAAVVQYWVDSGDFPYFPPECYWVPLNDDDFEMEHDDGVMHIPETVIEYDPDAPPDELDFEMEHEP